MLELMGLNGLGPMGTWTTEQVLALAPDASSAKSGKELAAPRKWVSLGQSEQAAWGECQGSARLPYQVSIDLSEPAFKCTCPSHKFPCKHSLGLFLMLAGQPTALKSGAPPAWVADWLKGRASRAEKKAAKAEQAEQAPADPEAQQKRAAEREAKVTAGLQELDLWLRDLVRSGLAAAQTQPDNFWEAPARRMVDAQGRGVAGMIQEMSGIPASGEGWPERLLAAAGRVHLLREGYTRLPTLPPATQADVRTAIGWTQKQEALLAAGPHQHDTWLVLGQRVEQEDDLRVQRSWVWGHSTDRPALLLHFAHASQPLDASLVPGTCFEADLVFFPSAFPLRALIKQRQGSASAWDRMPGYPTITAAIQAYASALAANPWLERFPLALPAAVPVRRGEQWWLRDAEGRRLPITPHFERGWELLALSGGNPLGVFGEWNGESLRPLSMWAGRFLPL